MKKLHFLLFLTSFASSVYTSCNNDKDPVYRLAKAFQVVCYDNHISAHIENQTNTISSMQVSTGAMLVGATTLTAYTMSKNPKSKYLLGIGSISFGLGAIKLVASIKNYLNSSNIIKSYSNERDNILRKYKKQ